MVGTVERAFQLAPECKSIAELRTKLIREARLQQHRCSPAGLVT